MVEVFKTNIADKQTAKEFIKQVQNLFPSAQVSFDLEDCDKILRIENDYTLVTEIEKLFAGYDCIVLN